MSAYIIAANRRTPLWRLPALAFAFTFAIGCGPSQKQMQKQDLDGPAFRAEMAQAFMAKGAYGAAIPLLRRSVEEAPKNASMRFLYATSLRERGAAPQAESQFLITVKLAPNMAAAWSGLGMVYDQLHQPERAEKAHRTATRVAPRSADAWNNLGFSLFVAGKVPESKVALKRALDIDPGLAVAHNNLGFVYASERDYDRALRSFRVASADEGAFHNLAIAYERNGDTAAATAVRESLAAGVDGRKGER